MLISGRTATRHLQTCGLTERSARKVLAAGLAGEPTHAAGALLYDERRVLALMARTALTPAELPEPCSLGLFVARRPGTIDDLAAGWPLSLAARFWVGHLVRQHSCLPLVATVSGFVTTGAEIVDVQEEDGSTRARPRERLHLRAAGSWFAEIRDRRLELGPGPSWLLLNVPGWDAGRSVG